MAAITVSELFLSLQGEGRSSGYPTTFVRLGGCPLRCSYCDTAFAWEGGKSFTIDEIIGQIAEFGVARICVTGGEPLAQSTSQLLLEQLCNAGYQVSLETSGAFDISGVDTRVSRVIDIKTPGSGEMERNLWSNLEQINSNDQIKFVICDRLDFDWALETVRMRQLDQLCEVLFSPVAAQLESAELADWIVAERAPVRLQLQLHRVVWGDERGR